MKIFQVKLDGKIVMQGCMFDDGKSVQHFLGRDTWIRNHASINQIQDELQDPKAVFKVIDNIESML